MLALLLVANISKSLSDERIAVLTGDVAEIICALDYCRYIVGREQAATYPPEILNVPEIGYHRSLNAETILSVKPTLVLGSSASQPVSIWEKINQVGIKAIKISEEPDGSDFAKRIEFVGTILGKAQEAKKISNDWTSRIKSLQTNFENNPKRYLVTLDGRLVAGNHTAADTLIKWAGGINAAAAAGIDGYKTMNREAWLQANPDIIILTEHGKGMYGSVKEFSDRPEISSTTAGKTKNIRTMNADLILRVGLRSPDTIQKIQTWKANASH